MTTQAGPPTGQAGAPIDRAERITNLDSLRGVAVLGILVMNSVSYGLPEAAYFNIDAAGSGSWLDRTLAIAGEIFVDQKTMALFSILFGAGIVLFADRAEIKGRRPVWFSLWRNLLLLGIGVLHTLVWDGDILTVYALCSPVLLLLRKRSVRTLLITGTIAVLTSAVWAASAQIDISDSGAELGTFWFVDGGTIGDTAGVFLLADFFLRSLGMMLIGVALYRLEILNGTWPREFYIRMVRIGLLVGLPLTIAGVIVQAAGDYGPDVALIGQAPNTLATIPIALAYVGLITLWAQRSETNLHRRIQAAGQMALTNYLTQTILGIIILRSVFARGELSRSAIWLFVLVVWVLQILWSQPWLARFRFGPFEWLWRIATYRKFQPLRRTS